MKFPTFVCPVPSDMPSNRDTISCAIARAWQLAIQVSFQHSCVIYRLRNETSFTAPPLIALSNILC